MTLAQAAEPTKAKPNERLLHCWRIEQQNFFFGECTIYACPEALKVTFVNGKWMNIAKAPGWELYVLNPGQKVYFHTPLDKWKANKVQQNLLNATAAELINTHKTSKIAGQIVEETVSKVKDSQQINAHYWIARDMKLPDQIYHVICGNDIAPNLHAIPFKIAMKSNMVTDAVDTKSCSRVDLPSSFFDLPSGYKMTSNAEDVMNTGVTGIIKDMAGF
jgi:hypothetical protein